MHTMRDHDPSQAQGGRKELRGFGFELDDFGWGLGKQDVLFSFGLDVRK